MNTLKINKLSNLVNLININLTKNKNLYFVKDLFNSYCGNDWKKYINNNLNNNSNNYYKELLYNNDKFELFLINWNKKSFSKIHDHSKNGCLFKIVDGELTENIYNKDIKLIKINKYKKDDCGFISNELYYHKIFNNNNFNSYSLHLYSPPLYKIKTFN